MFIDCLNMPYDETVAISFILYHIQNARGSGAID